MLAVFHEQSFQPVEQIALWAKMTQITALGVGLLRLLLHFEPVIAVKAVTFDQGGVNPIPKEDVLHRDANRRGAGSRRTGNRNNRVLLRHDGPTE